MLKGYGSGWSEGLECLDGGVMRGLEGRGRGYWDAVEARPGEVARAEAGKGEEEEIGGSGWLKR